MRPTGSAALVAVVLGTASAFVSASVLASDACGTAEEFDSIAFEGTISSGDTYRRRAGDHLTFMLVPQPFGWIIEVVNDSSADLAVATPPLHMPAANPRTISGWHFRNAANTGPNEGEISAPQDVRTFLFGRSSLDLPPPVPAHGRGELRIDDYGLADILPGQQARMVWLRFSACLEWNFDPPLPAGPDRGDAPDVVPTWLVRAFRDCGLGNGIALSDHMSVGVRHRQPNHLEPDFDGDGTRELVAPIVRESDGKRGLAVCWRRSSRLDLLGLDADLGKQLTPVYFDGMDLWSVYSRRGVGQGVAEGPPPTLDGEGVLIGIDEKSSVLLYWDGDAFSAYWQGD